MNAAIWREPLLHFLLIGVATFGGYAYVVEPRADEEKTIVVDRDRLLTYLQFRLKRFADDSAARQLDRMSAAELERVVDEYVRDEVLYREAKKLGLDRDDDVIRQRLIQKIEFINQSVAAETLAPTDADVRQYYAAHEERYREPAHVTFTHVFFRAEDGNAMAARERALAVQRRLNDGRVPFEAGPRLGDRFLFQVNHVESPAALVASHFGQAMGAALFELRSDDRRWQGPFESPYGTHLVMLIDNVPERRLTLDEARPRVMDDLRRDVIAQRENAVIADVVKTYAVRSLVQPEG